MQKLLITGIDSLVGINLALSLSDRFEIHGLAGLHSVQIEDCHVRHADLTHPGEVAVAVDRVSPKWIIHCGPLSNSNWNACDSSADNEPAVVTALMHAAAESGARLAVISTDAILAGPDMFHGEESECFSASHVAGAAKAVEGVLAASSALIVRTHAYGWGLPETSSFAAELWEAISDGRPCGLDSQRHATPVLATDLAELLVRAFQRGVQGLYHLSGAERTSPARFAAEMAALCGVRLNLPTDSEPRSQPIRALAAQETSLNTRKARRDLGMPMPMLHDGLSRFAEQAANGYRERVQSAIGSLEEMTV